MLVMQEHEEQGWKNTHGAESTRQMTRHLARETNLRDQERRGGPCKRGCVIGPVEA
jgi:hypothetical protein